MKIRVDDEERQVIIDHYFRIGGVIVPNVYCESCSSIVIYSDKYDDEFCPACNKWLTNSCGDSSCMYCKIRPVQPLEIKTLSYKFDKNKI